MILSDRDILASMQQEDGLRVEPFDPKALQPCSIDLHLDRHFLCYKIDVDAPAPVIDFAKDGAAQMAAMDLDQVLLFPGHFLLGNTIEKVSVPHHLAAILEGKSSLARRGLLVHVTAGFIDPGNRDLRITLELCNLAPIPMILRAGMPIGQVQFTQLTSPVENPYGPHRGSHYFADQSVKAGAPLDVA